ncbi:MAG TPA: DUF1840 domain-containing protein [Steroidobacteraceae bacterium]
MIVVFSTRHGQLTLLGESAVALLKLAGHSGTVPGAVLSADLPAFLARLRAGLAQHGDELSPAPTAQSAQDEADEDESSRESTAVSLRKRAVPLLDMVETAVARGSDLMWERH